MLGVLLAAALVPSTAAASVWSGLVRARGGAYMTDSLGRRLQLHGVNLVAKCGGGAVATKAAGNPCVGPMRGSQPAFVLTPTAKDPGRRFTARDAQTLARLGFTVVRLGVIWQGLEPGPAGVGPNNPKFCTPHTAGTPFPKLGASDPYRASVLKAYLTKVNRTVGLLARAGIRVIIDMHQDAWGSAFSLATGSTPWNGEGRPTLGHLHERQDVHAAGGLGPGLRHACRHRGHPQLLLQRCQRQPPGAVRPRVDGGGPLLPRQPQRARLRAVQRADRLRAAQLRP